MNFETWPEASMNTAVKSLYKSLPWDGLDLFYGNVSLGCISQFTGERLQDHWSSCYWFASNFISSSQNHKPEKIVSSQSLNHFMLCTTV